MKNIWNCFQAIFTSFFFLQLGWGQEIVDFTPYLQEIRETNKNLSFYTIDIGTKEALDKFRSDPLPAIETVLKAQDRLINISTGQIRLRIFKPDVIKGIVIDIHGGGWSIGSPEGSDMKNDLTARSSQVAVISIDYHLAPETKVLTQIQECTEAVTWILNIAKSEFGTDKIILQGQSAGAHLAVSTLLKLKENKLLDKRIVGINLTYGVYDLGKTPSLRQATDNSLILRKSLIDQFWNHAFGEMGQMELQQPAMSPMFAELSDLPQALFSVGTADPLKDDTYFMASRWKSAGNKATIDTYPECPHIFNDFPTKIAELANQRMNSWITNILKYYP